MQGGIILSEEGITLKCMGVPVCVKRVAFVK